MEQFKVIAIREKKPFLVCGEESIKSLISVAKKLDGNTITELQISCSLNSRESVKQLIEFLKITERYFCLDRAGIGEIQGASFNANNKTFSIMGANKTISIKEDDLIEFANKYQKK